MLGDSRLIRSISLRNFLSYGDSGDPLETKSLNVLIGPNASGKSNLIEAVGLLQAAPKELAAPIREGGGVSEWLWKGRATPTPVAEIDVTVFYPDGAMALRHKLAFTMVGQRFELVDEAVDLDDVYFFYRYQHGHPALNVRTEVTDPAGTTQGRVERKLRREELEADQSVLSQRKDPDRYPEITYLGNQYSKIRLYREWNLGRYTPPRMPQKADLPSDFLSESADNLGLVLNELEYQAGARTRLLENLRTFHESIDDVYTRIHGGTVQVFVHEKGLGQPIAATRLSDGTLRYLCLLTILCHPSPPPVICVEEPELGLHPDALPAVAELLVDASNRTQLFVTTHSEILVDALSKTPEAVLICEKESGSTALRRLDPEALRGWLEKYSLGQLWRRGELGGNRW